MDQNLSKEIQDFAGDIEEALKEEIFKDLANEYINVVINESDPIGYDIGYKRFCELLEKLAELKNVRKKDNSDFGKFLFECVLSTIHSIINASDDLEIERGHVVKFINKFVYIVSKETPTNSMIISGIFESIEYKLKTYKSVVM